MPENLTNLTTEEIKRAFIEETRRFMEGITSGLSFDALKEIRVKLRQMEVELNRRGIDI